MLTEIQLKEKLQAIALKDFQLDQPEEYSALLPDMLHYIGSTDSTLRDDLIYSTFAAWIYRDKRLTPVQLHHLLHNLLSDQYMFYRIGEQDTDSVFQRSFSVLLLPLILDAHRTQPFLNPDEIHEVEKKLLRFLKEENDRRGFVLEKGWAHTAAHTADALDELAQCREIGAGELSEILQAVQAAVTTAAIVYTYGEEERLVTPVIAILRRSLISDNDLTAWVLSFAEPVLKAASVQQKIMLRSNIKNFLQSLYFRLLWEETGKDLLDPVNQTLRKISAFCPPQNQ